MCVRVCVMRLERKIRRLFIGGNGWLFKSHVGSGLLEESDSVLQNGRSILFFYADENISFQLLKKLFSVFSVLSANVTHKMYLQYSTNVIAAYGTIPLMVSLIFTL